jgi:hypothetical protein
MTAVSYPNRMKKVEKATRAKGALKAQAHEPVTLESQDPKVKKTQR